MDMKFVVDHDPVYTSIRSFRSPRLFGKEKAIQSIKGGIFIHHKHPRTEPITSTVANSVT